MNFVEIVFLLKKKKRWLNAHILVFNLASADATLGFTTATTISFWLSQRNYKAPFVILRNCFFYGNIYESIFIVMLISVDRWIAVKWLFGYRTLMTKKRVCIGALSAWITSVSLVSAVFVFKLYGGIYIFRILTITGIIVLVYLNSSIFLLYRKSIKMMKVDRRFTGHCQRRKMQRKNSKFKDKNSMATVSLSMASSF